MDPTSASSVRDDIMARVRSRSRPSSAVSPASGPSGRSTPTAGPGHGFYDDDDDDDHDDDDEYDGLGGLRSDTHPGTPTRQAALHEDPLDLEHPPESDHLFAAPVLKGEEEPPHRGVS